MTVKHPSGTHHERVREHLDRIPKIHRALRDSYQGPPPDVAQQVEQQVAADVQTIAADAQP